MFHHADKIDKFTEVTCREPCRDLFPANSMQVTCAVQLICMWTRDYSISNSNAFSQLWCPDIILDLKTGCCGVYLVISALMIGVKHRQYAMAAFISLWRIVPKALRRPALLMSCLYASILETRTVVSSRRPWNHKNPVLSGFPNSYLSMPRARQIWAVALQPCTQCTCRG